MCLDRLEVYANSSSTVVLVEVLDSHDQPKTFRESRNAKSFPFLRALSSDINGARYQKQVVLFAVVVNHPPEPDATLDAATTTSCLNAGATEIVRSPFGNEDINRLVGHFKEKTRPAARLLAASMAQNLVTSIHTSEAVPSRHRPDQSLSVEREKAVRKAIADWHFPAHDFSMDELTCGVVFMLENCLKSSELEAYSLSRADLMSFILAVRRQYKHEREVHYHNWRHAVDVTQSLYDFLLNVGLRPPADGDTAAQNEKKPLEQLLTPLDGLILLISAIGHDVGHPGVNNAFLVACNHPLAQMYNDKSVLENYHCAAYTQLLRRYWPSLNTIPAFRATLISNILATDMQRHFEYMGKLGELKQKIGDSEPDLSDWNDKDKDQARELIMALLMKAADISNVARPFDVSAAWAKILMNEFARQGELESELSIPTCLFGGPPNKEDLLAAAQSQKGFMSLFGFPLFSGMAELMPSVTCAIKELEQNQATWEQKIQSEKERRESGGEHAPLTFSSIGREEVEEAQEKHHRSDPAVLPGLAASAPGTPKKRPTGLPGIAPDEHPMENERQQFTFGFGGKDDHRASAPFLGTSALPVSLLQSASRRSSKDLALDHLQHLNHAAGQRSPDSRRGSADASFHINQSFPSSRRGSKDESLTTILVTSQGSPNRRHSPSSPSKPASKGNSSPNKPSGKRQSIPRSHQQQTSSAARNSIPSSRSHATSSATATTSQQSPSTQPSSIAATDDEPTPPIPHHQSIAATEDPFQVPGNWPDNLDGEGHRTSIPRNQPPANQPSTPPIPPGPTSGMETASKDESAAKPHASTTSGESESRPTPRKSEPQIRESRSRSRLRGLKFWKKKRDVSGVESGPEGNSP